MIFSKQIKNIYFEQKPHVAANAKAFAATWSKWRDSTTYALRAHVMAHRPPLRGSTRFSAPH